MDFFDHLMNAGPVVIGRIAPSRRCLGRVLGDCNREVHSHFRVFAPRLAVSGPGLGICHPKTGWQTAFALLRLPNLLQAVSRLAGFGARLERSLQMEAGEQMQRLQAGLSFLATVGSTAPFVGLFGTVWGIMHSFGGIAAAKDTSLATVAPGIAEALFATAIGLAAAIPAVLFYNQANVSLSRIAARLSVAVARLAKELTYALLPGPALLTVITLK